METNKQPEIEYTEEDIIDLEPVDPAKRSLRLISGLIDIIIVFLVGFGLSKLFLLTPLGNQYYAKRYLMQDIEDQYKITKLIPGSEETYGHKLYSYEPDYNSKVDGHRIHNDENGDYIVINNDEISDAVLNAYKNAIEKDSEYMQARKDTQNLNFTLSIVPMSISEILFFLVVPLCNKNRMSLGKMPFKFYVISYTDFKQSKWWNILISTAFIILIDTALPLYFLGMWTILLTPLLVLISTFFSKRGRTLHDALSITYVVDGRTYSTNKIDRYFDENRSN